MDSVEEFSSQDLDILSRAYDRALGKARATGRDIEAMKTVLLDTIVSAARGGERDERLLEACGLAALRQHEA